MKEGAIAAVRGMRDILPGDITAWQRLERAAAACFAAYGYGELRTPIVERMDLFARQIGETTDVVQKEMYRFMDAAGDKDDNAAGDEVALRPEATVSTVRALLAAGRRAGEVERVWYGGAMFRRERPQKGRYRQFHQLGAEALGKTAPGFDAEQIVMLARLWRELGVDAHLRLSLNNLGGLEERLRYREKLKTYFQARESNLHADDRRRIAINPLRILDSKHSDTLAIVAEAPALAHELGDESRRYVDTVREKLAAASVAFEDNPLLVRGLDYYNLTVYEWSLTDSERRQSAVCGGGRYDGLAQNIGGGDYPGCGFALGMERIIDLMPPAPAPGVDCFIAPVMSSSDATKDGDTFADTIAEQCRDGGLTVWRHIGGGNIGKQLKKADAARARLALIIGNDELAGGYITIKRLSDGAQEKAAAAEIVNTSRRLLDAQRGR